MTSTPPEEPVAWTFHPWRIVVGVACVWLALTWADHVDRGTFFTWPGWVKWALGMTMLFLTLGGVFLAINGVGLLTSEVLAYKSEDRAPTLSIFVAVYFSLVFGSLILALATSAILNVHWVRPVFLSLGIAFVTAATRRPWWLYGTIRRTGWFALIRSDRAMQVLLGLLGLYLITLAIFLPEEVLPQYDSP